ncbi:hypothetical protein AB0912_15400 [Streptomyces sp. NPDC007084]|uniref:hypothetical protein n=1 Tax=Streptomyces sp. NPDC007084 TaxID=3154313 RepID=UPI003452C687
MRKPSPDGLGPTCRRKERARRRSTAFKAADAARRRLGKPVQTAPGQLAIPTEFFPMSQTRPATSAAPGRPPAHRQLDANVPLPEIRITP